MDEVRVVEARDLADVAAVAHLYDEVLRPDAAQRFLDDPTHHLVVAYVGDVGVGFASGVEMTHPDKGTEMFLYELAVDEEHQRRGIGTRLVRTLEEIARSQGCYGMWVLTDHDNDAALATYRAGGAEPPTAHVMLTWTFTEPPAT
jgi:ribosomal protein S18 acetylase RimI-like enzyme